MSAPEPVRCVATWALPLFLAACASTPLDEAQPGHRPSDDTDEAGLWQMLEREEYQLRTSASVIRDEALQGYLESVLCRVTPAYCADIRVYVLPSPYFDAAMTPNGMMLVYTGLLVRLENEAQLAAVLGHETGHYVKKHSLEQWRLMRSRLDAIQGTASILTAAVTVGYAVPGTAAAASSLFRPAAAASTMLRYSLVLATFIEQRAYSREQEREADEFGVSQTLAAGYDASTVQAVWNYLAKEEALADRRPPAFLRTHPLPEERERRALAQTGHDRQTVSGEADVHRDRFLTHVAPYRNEWLHLARQGLDVEPQRLLLDRQRQIGVSEGLVSFHEASMYRVRNGKGDAERALEALAEAVESQGCPPEAYREYGLTLWDEMRTEEARRAFEAYLAAAPAAADRAMVASYVSELR